MPSYDNVTGDTFMGIKRKKKKYCIRCGTTYYTKCKCNPQFYGKAW